ncbi:hypothetical protein HK101_006102 [Irineochytrium annulatum]|nr:hypothetical protein HK101_006102 [Irineochytrium annulatum]
MGKVEGLKDDAADTVDAFEMVEHVDMDRCGGFGLVALLPARKGACGVNAGVAVGNVRGLGDAKSVDAGDGAKGDAAPAKAGDGNGEGEGGGGICIEDEA